MLFGSRLDDSKRGGDIDLLVEADLSLEEMFIKKITNQGQLQRALGEQKSDLLTAPIDTENVPEVVEIARKQGVRLCKVPKLLSIQKNAPINTWSGN